ncbi:MAG TPA: hypothetical protein EYH56_00800 [Nanoarchaeota archaeon]|nr:hypothetical protein [Nanoarchaeota archaeon]
MEDILKEIKKLFAIKGKTLEETLENISFLIIVFSAILVSIGIALGSFYKGVILLASLGSFTLLIGIIIFVIAEVMRE